MPVWFNKEEFKQLEDCCGKEGKSPYAFLKDLFYKSMEERQKNDRKRSLPGKSIKSVNDDRGKHETKTGYTGIL